MSSSNIDEVQCDTKKMKTHLDIEMIVDYSTIIQSAIDSLSVDTSILEWKYDGTISVKENLDVIINNIGKSMAPFKATVVSLVAKMKHPEWDTRKHQIQIGGKFSLRTIDKCYVAAYLFKKGYYDTPTEFALTRSFEKSEPYTKSYTGNISPKEAGRAFLNIAEVINTTECVPLIKTMLAYLMMFLRERTAKNTALKTSSTLETSKKLSLEDISKLLDSFNTLGSGISVLPVIVVHTVLSVVQQYLFPAVAFPELKEHTASDMKSRSYGDVEGFNNNTPLIVIEVKHNIVINETIVMNFDKKTNDASIPLKYILTTSKTSRHFVKNNICIDTVSGFTISYLQQSLLHDANICSIFMKELRINIMSYHNLPVDKKENINNIIISLLA